MPRCANELTSKTAALNAYSSLLQAYAKAGLTANPDEPDLAANADGAALKALRDALAGFKAKGEIFKGEYRSTPTVAAVSPTDSPTSVVVTDCLDTKNQLVYKATGGLADDEPGGRRSTAATVRRQGGAWKVVNLDVREKGTC